MLIIVAAIATVSVPLLLVTYNKVRPYFSVTVKCWFCGKKTVVPYGNINCWDCPECEQYNGFQEDGDYNKPIPSQYDESLNFACAGGHYDSCSDGLHLESENGLCPTCNYNQLVKIRLLANFEPLKEENYESEVDAYKTHLERVYGMCHECSLYVQRRLTEQDSFLWPQLRNFWLASGSLLQTHSTRGRLGFSLMLMTGCLSSFVASLLLLGLFQKIHLAIVSPFLMKVSGTALSLGSVLLAGREQFGPVDLLLCWFWFISHLLSLPCISTAMELEQMRRLQALVIGAAALFAVARVVLCALRLKRGRISEVRKLTTSTRMTSQPVLGEKFGLNQAADSKSVSSRNCTESAMSCKQTERTEKKSTLHEMMGGFHISPESAKHSSHRSDVSGRSYLSSRTSVEKDEGAPLLWPPKLSRLSSSSTKESWMVGGAWVVGGGLSGGTPQINWGVKQAYGVLTPPPSQTGSTASFHTALPSRKTTFESFQSFGNPEHAGNVWLNLKSRAEPQNFYSATKNKPFLGFGHSAFTAVPQRRSGWCSRSTPDDQRQIASGASAQLRSSPHQRSYAHSSVSQDTCGERSRAVSSVTLGRQGSPSNKSRRFLWQNLFMSFSVVTNILLFTYFMIEPTTWPAWLWQFLDKFF
ncbi:uncharacterized protein LOC135369932 [Ornithodoros turicata]|uniref:uncharacterized protein LOC135369932 n=1 Tax=Ornithodoros turicata TaxID=34597 RepID=UPI003139130C